MAFKGYSDKYKVSKGKTNKQEDIAINNVVAKGKTIVDRFSNAAAKNSRRGVF